MMKVVITQSMLFPWVGMLEQINLANTIVHYDDVQYSKGSYVNRVQLKMPEGIKWMTIPLLKANFGQCIDELRPNEEIDWRKHHLQQLNRCFINATFRDDAIQLVEEVYNKEYDNIGQLSRASMLALCDYFDLITNQNFIDIKTLNVSGSSSSRVLEVVKKINGTVYITGHGAANYLDHNHFEASNIDVRYMNYNCTPYHQAFGLFTPYVSSLDLVANLGRAGRDFIKSETISWKEFTNERN
jgi:hypothetical protein